MNEPMRLPWSIAEKRGKGDPIFHAPAIYVRASCKLLGDVRQLEGSINCFDNRYTSIGERDDASAGHHLSAGLMQHDL
jgi:hypothetical protein